MPGPRLQQKVSRVRFAFGYSIILILVQCSTGFVQLFYRLPMWFTGSQNSSLNSQLSASNSSKTFSFLKVSSLLYLLINPMAVFFSNQDIKIFKQLLCHWCRSSANIRTTDDDDEEDKTLGDTTESMSRFATRQETTLSQNVNENDDDGKDIETEINSTENEKPDKDKEEEPVNNNIETDDGENSTDTVIDLGVTKVSIHHQPETGMNESENVNANLTTQV